MKSASAGLIALLASSNELCMWEIYTITLVDGTVLTWTDGDVAGVTGLSSVAGETTANLIA